MYDAFANREREREREKQTVRDKMHQTADLYGRDSFPECAEGAYSIVSLHRTSRTLLRSDTILTVAATITFRQIRSWTGQSSTQRSPDFPIIHRFHHKSIVRLKSDSLNSMKVSPLPEDYAKSDRRCAAATINNRAPERSFLDLRPLVIHSPSLHGKNHFRKLDGPRIVRVVRLYNLQSVVLTMTTAYDRNLFSISTIY